MPVIQQGSQSNVRAFTTADQVTVEGQVVPVISAASATYTSLISLFSANTAKYKRVDIDINITAISGTSPTVTFFIERISSDGATYFNIGELKPISATGKVSISIGEGVTDHVPASSPGTTGGDLDWGFSDDVGSQLLLAGVLGGTSPSVTMTCYAYGR